MSQANDFDDVKPKKVCDTSKAKRRLQLSHNDEARNDIFKDDDDSFEAGLSQMNDNEYGMFTQAGKMSSLNDVTPLGEGNRGFWDGWHQGTNKQTRFREVKCLKVTLFKGRPKKHNCGNGDTVT